LAVAPNILDKEALATLGKILLHMVTMTCSPTSIILSEIKTSSVQWGKKMMLKQQAEVE
jgi:hypothetical protein